MKTGIVSIIEKVLSELSKKVRSLKKSGRIVENALSEEDLLTQIRSTRKSLLELDADSKKQKNEDVKKMIAYFNQLTQNIEERRSRLIESSWQTLTILVAASSILIAIKPPTNIRIPVLVVFSIQIFFSILKLIEYQWQSAYRYSFRDIKEYSNKWKWFYYGNPFITNIDTNPFRKSVKKEKSIYPYLQGLGYFLENYKAETPDSELENNIVQLYLLQVHNYYKNRFYLRLNNYDLIANRWSFRFIAAYLGLILGIWLYNLISF